MTARASGAFFPFRARAGRQNPGPEDTKENDMEKIESGKLRGTRILSGAQALAQRTMEAKFRSCLHRSWL